MDDHVNDSETVTRFLEDKKHYQLPSGPIKIKAFFPSYKYAAVSVFRIDGCSAVEIWQLADNVVAPSLKDLEGEFRASADLAVDDIRRVSVGTLPR